MKIFFQLIINGICIGSTYGVMAISLCLIWGILKVVNFAHGIFLVYALFAVYFLFTLWGIDPYLGIFIVFPLFFLLGMGVYKLIISRIVNASFFTQAFMTNGLEMLMRGLAFLIFGVTYRSVTPSYAYNNLNIFGFKIGFCNFLAILINISAVLILSLFFNKTYMGKAIRALSQQRRGAMLVGIKVSHLFMIGFALGLGYVAIAGVAMSTTYSIFPTLGQVILLVAFVTIILGGQDIMGTFYAGLLIGLVEVFMGYYIDIGLKEIMYLLIFIVVLLFRPTGIVNREVQGV